MARFIVHGFCDDDLKMLTYWGFMIIEAEKEHLAVDEYTDKVNEWVEKTHFNYEGEMPVTQTLARELVDGKVDGATINESTLDMLTKSWPSVYVTCQPTDCTTFKE